MKVIWFSFLFQILVLSLVKNLFIEVDILSHVFIFIHVIVSLLVILFSKSGHKYIFMVALLVRVLFLFWDIYARGIYILPNSGADSEDFYLQTLYFSQNISTVFQVDGELYSKITGYILYLIGPRRIVAQYLNVILGLSVIMILSKILEMLRIDSHLSKKMLFIASFFPISIIMSAIFLREIFPTFFIVCSLYFFVKWHTTGGFQNIIISLIMVILSSLFHSGVIGVSVGLIFAYLFYNRKNNKIEFTSITILLFLSFCVLGTLVFNILGNSLLIKFQNISDISDIYVSANSRLGESAYLLNLSINNMSQLILFAPLKTLFFLTSPLPINWRGIMDVFTFFTDSILYLGTFYYFFKNKKFFFKDKQLIINLMLMILGASIIFGIGVSNAGTAVRHRQKLTPIVFVAMSVMIYNKKNFIATKEQKNKE